jgi:hypothetical protein
MKGMYNLIEFDYEIGKVGPETDSVYISPTGLKGLVNSHMSRPLCRIYNPKNGKSILRFVRGKAMNGLDKNSITMDYLNMRELSASAGNELEIIESSIIDRIFWYPIFHPSEQIRIAFWYFIASLILQILI